MGICLLHQNDFAAGWREYDWRWVADQRAPRSYSKPVWAGESVIGKTLLLYAEQGLGDAIQFARFVPHLVAAGARVVLEVHPQLMHLMRTLEGVAEVIPLHGTTPHFDLYQALMSVPGVLGITPQTIPAKVPYISADPSRAEWGRPRLGGHGFKVGVIWQGKGETLLQRARSATLASLAPLARIKSVRLISLQKEIRAESPDPRVGNLPIETLGPEFDSGPDAFRDTAAIMESLDLVITIDSAAAHLAGALGRPVWIALKAVPDWRWRTEGTASPWYPSATLFRQTDTSDWDHVFAGMAEKLQELVGGLRLPVEPDRTPPPLPAPPSTTDHDYSRWDRFMGTLTKDIYRAFPAAPHESITRMIIDDFHRSALLGAGLRVLDIGCGDGLALELFRNLGMETLGITLGPDRELHRAKGFDVREMDQNFMAFADGEFDFLWCRLVLAHSLAPLFTLSEYRRVTKPGGRVYIEVPAPDTSAHHEGNIDHCSVLPLSSWLNMFARSNFAVERSTAINFTAPSGPDTHWSFLLRRNA
jgi:SAM-dependent methyltransferase